MINKKKGMYAKNAMNWSNASELLSKIGNLLLMKDM